MPTAGLALRLPVSLALTHGISLPWLRETPPHQPQASGPHPNSPMMGSCSTSNRGAWGARTSSPAQGTQLWRKEASLSYFFLFSPAVQALRGWPLPDAGQWAVSSMVFFCSSRCSSQSSSGSYVPLMTATRSLRLRELGKSR